jgi:hypothetical protein
VLALTCILSAKSSTAHASIYVNKFRCVQDWQSPGIYLLTYKDHTVVFGNGAVHSCNELTTVANQPARRCDGGLLVIPEHMFVAADQGDSIEEGDPKVTYGCRAED